jgi:hypothetical protein
LGKFRLFSPDTALWRSGRKTGMGSENWKLCIVNTNIWKSGNVEQLRQQHDKMADDVEILKYPTPKS